MRFSYVLFIIVCFVSCNRNPKNIKTDSVSVPQENRIDSTPITSEKQMDSLLVTSYSNERFKEVTVNKVDVNKFMIEGQGQIFEANFGWVVEDGHNELAKGFEMTDAGAPEWGKFKFEVEVEKQRPNSTLMLILFETSAKDGSRQHELPIVLE